MFTHIFSSHSKSSAFLPLAFAAAFVFAFGTAWSADGGFISASDEGTALMDAIEADSSGPASVAISSPALASPVVSSAAEDLSEFTGDNFSSTDYMDAIESLSPAPALPARDSRLQSIDVKQSPELMDAVEAASAD